MPILRRGAATLRYEVYGSGYPLLALAPGGMRSRIERWHDSVAFKDPTAWLSECYRVIAPDQRNAGQSRAPVGEDDGWRTYLADHLALLDHLGIERFHILGACIGVSFALQLCDAVPDRVASAVLQNPIGLVPGNRPVVDKLFTDWAADQAGREDIDHSQLPGFHDRLFGGDFIFSVSRDAVRRCATPLLLLPGMDDIHPAAISAEIAALAPNVELVNPWKGPALLDGTAATVERFLTAHTDP